MNTHSLRRRSTVHNYSLDKLESIKVPASSVLQVFNLCCLRRPVFVIANGNVDGTPDVRNQDIVQSWTRAEESFKIGSVVDLLRR